MLLDSDAASDELVALFILGRRLFAFAFAFTVLSASILSEGVRRCVCRLRSVSTTESRPENGACPLISESPRAGVRPALIARRGQMSGNADGSHRNFTPDRMGASKRARGHASGHGGRCKEQPGTTTTTVPPQQLRRVQSGQSLLKFTDRSGRS